MKFPSIGLGTWKCSDEVIESVVYESIRLGYRMIDCAFEYLNEKGVGKALKRCIDEGIVTRNELIICTKLWNCFHNAELA